MSIDHHTRRSCAGRGRHISENHADGERDHDEKSRGP